MSKVRLIQGMGDPTATPPTGASDADLSHIANDFIAQAGVLRLIDGDCLVEESDTPGMSVKVAPGIVYVENSSWAANSIEPRFYQVVRPDEEAGVSISSNPSGSTRIDLICQKIDKVTTPNDDASNVAPIIVVEGTPGGGAPAVPSDHECLAEIEVADGASAITNTEITDRRRLIFARPSMVNPGLSIVADGATITFDLLEGIYNKFFTAVEGDRTLAVDNVPVGFPFMVIVQQANGGGHDPVWWANILWEAGVEPTWSTTDGAVDTFGFIKLASGDYLGYVMALNQQ